MTTIKLNNGIVLNVKTAVVKDGVLIFEHEQGIWNVPLTSVESWFHELKSPNIRSV